MPQEVTELLQNGVMEMPSHSKDSRPPGFYVELHRIAKTYVNRERVETFSIQNCLIFEWDV